MYKVWSASEYDSVYGMTSSDFYIRCPRGSKLFRRLKEHVPGFRELRDEDGVIRSDIYKIPGDITNWRKLLFFGGDELDITDTAASAVIKMMDDEESDIQAANRMSSPKVKDQNMYNMFYHHQVAGAEFLKTVKRALLTDEMGVGKTATVIAATKMMHLVGHGSPVLVVAPKTMLNVWKQEFNKWFETANVTVIDGSKQQKTNQIREFVQSFSSQYTNVMVISYDTARTMSKKAAYGSFKTGEEGPLNDLKFGTVVLDEAHKIKNPSAQQTRACWYLGEKAYYRFALTGTPVANHAGDLWSILRFLDKDKFPSRNKYIDYYCKTWDTPWGSTEILGILEEHRHEFDRMVGAKNRRVLKKSVLKDLPEKQYQTIYLDMQPKQAKAYKQMAKGWIAEINGGHVSAVESVSKFTRLSQFAQAYLEEVDGKYIMTDPSNKIDALLELLESSEGKPVVVYSDSKQLLHLAQNRLDKARVGFRTITGDHSADERLSAVQEFQEGKVDLLLCSLRAANSGITLTRADTMIFLNKSWSMVENKQAEDRIHRVGSTHDNVQYITLVSKGTVEVGQQRILEGKYGALQDVVRDEDLMKRLIDGNERD